MTSLALAGAAVAMLLVLGCSSDDSNVMRGRGMSVATLPDVERAHVYEAAARASFDVSDEALSLLLDPRLLPRTVGLVPDGRANDSVVAELRRRGAIKGTCEPALQGTKGTARCTATLPGYVLRFSPVFTLGSDSTQVYVYAQKYDTPGSGISETLRFERAYQVVRRGTEWRAVREGRVPKEIRGEPKP